MPGLYAQRHNSHRQLASSCGWRCQSDPCLVKRLLNTEFSESSELHTLIFFVVKFVHQSRGSSSLVPTLFMGKTDPDKRGTGTEARGFSWLFMVCQRLLLVGPNKNLPALFGEGDLRSFFVCVCVCERVKPVNQHKGAVQCGGCHRWFKSRWGLAVHPCRLVAH